jgi:hypothetical protein
MAIDLEIVRRLKEQARISVEKRAIEAIRRDSRWAPIVYIPVGTTLLRFYMDTDNSVTRTFLRHKMNKTSVPCLDDRCEICSYLNEMDEKHPNFRGAWRLYPVGTTIAYVWIFRCTQENESVRIGTPVLLMGNYHLGRQLDDRIANMDDDALAKMINPLTDDVLWQLKSTRGHLSLAPTLETGTMDPLPASSYPLKECIHPEGQAPTTEQISQFIQIIDDTYRTYLDGCNGVRGGMESCG